MSQVQKVFRYSTLLVPFAFVLPGRLGTPLILIITALGLVSAVSSPEEIKKFLRQPVSILLGLQFVIVVIGLLFSSDQQQGWSDVERTSFLLACILIVFQMQRMKIPIEECVIVFTSGCLLITISALGYVVVALDAAERTNILLNGHTLFADLIDFHPTYLSVYFVLIFFFASETFRLKRSVLNGKAMIGLVLLMAYCIGMLIFLRSQLALLVFAMLLVLYFVVTMKRRAWLVTFALFAMVLLAYLLDVGRVETFFDRYGKNVSSALDQRLLVWRGTLEGIRTAPFFGLGTGSEQQLINSGYEKTGYREGIANSYNAHNQYLQFVARNGMVELAAFLVYLVLLFRKSLTMSNHTFLMFSMAVTLIMFAESFLSVQRGIVFFYFFSLAFNCLSEDSRPGMKNALN